MVGIIPNWRDSKKSSSSKFPLSTISQPRTTHARDYKWKDVWLRSMRPQISWTSKTYFAKLPPNFWKTVVSRNDIGELMKEYAEKEGFMSQPGRMLIRRMELSSLPYYYITCLWVLNVQKFINSFSMLPGGVSIALYSLPSLLEDKERKISTQAYWLKQLRF